MVLSASQQQQLIAAIEDLRMSAVNKEKTVHGWKLEWVLRAPNKSPRGDLCMIAPEGQKLYSVIAVKRKLGLEPPAIVAPAAAAGDANAGLPSSRLRERDEAVGHTTRGAPPSSEGGRTFASMAELVGRRVSIRWTGDPGKPWFNGIVAEYNSTLGDHLILYDDGEQKSHNLDEEEAVGQLKWLSGGASGSASKSAAAPKPKPKKATAPTKPAKVIAKKAPPKLGTVKRPRKDLSAVPPKPPKNVRPPLPPPKKRIKAKK